MTTGGSGSDGSGDMTNTITCYALSDADFGAAAQAYIANTRDLEVIKVMDAVGDPNQATVTADSLDAVLNALHGFRMAIVWVPSDTSAPRVFEVPLPLDVLERLKTSKYSPREQWFASEIEMDLFGLMPELRDFIATKLSPNYFTSLTEFYVRFGLECSPCTVGGVKKLVFKPYAASASIVGNTSSLANTLQGGSFLQIFAPCHAIDGRLEAINWNPSVPGDYTTTSWVDYQDALTKAPELTKIGDGAITYMVYATANLGLTAVGV